MPLSPPTNSPRSVLLVDIGPYEKKSPIVRSMLECPHDLSLLINSALGVEAQPWRSEFFPDARTIAANYRDSSAVREAVRRHMPDLAGVTTYSELAVPTTVELAQTLGLSPIARGSATALRDKAVMRKQLTEGGLCQPKFQRCATFEEVCDAIAYVGLPAIIKPVEMGASLAVRKIERSNDPQHHLGFDELLAYRYFLDARNIDSPSELYRFQYRLSSDVIVESYIPTRQEISVESFAFRGRSAIVSITDKLTGQEPVFDEWGHTTNIQLQQEGLASRIEQDIQRAVDALQISHSILHAEFRITPDGIPILVEIAGRMAGDLIPMLVREAVGVDLGKLSLDLAIDNEDFSVDRTKNQSAAIYFLDDPRKAEILDAHKDRILNVVESTFPRVSITECKIYRPDTVDLGRYGHVIFTSSTAEDLLACRSRLQTLLGGE